MRQTCIRQQAHLHRYTENFRLNLDGLDYRFVQLQQKEKNCLKTLTKMLYIKCQKEQGQSIESGWGHNLSAYSNKMLNPIQFGKAFCICAALLLKWFSGISTDSSDVCFVIPFSKNNELAKFTFSKCYRNNLLIPKCFRTANQLFVSDTSLLPLLWWITSDTKTFRKLKCR